MAGVELTGVARISPLLPQQQAFLYVHLWAPDAEIPADSLTVRLEGPLDVGAFSAAWRTVVERNEVLRTSFLWEGVSQPLQIVHQEVADLPQVIDVADLAPQERAAAMAAALDTAPLDLRVPPVWRLALVRLGGDVTEIHWRSHHLLLDGWSFHVILAELLALYEQAGHPGDLTLPPPVGPEALRAWLERLDRTAVEAAWREAFDGWSGPTPLPAVAGGDPGEGDQARLVIRRLGPAPTASLVTRARALHISEASLLSAAWAVVLARHAEAPEVTFGIVSSGRPPDLPGADRLVGSFARTLPLRIAVQWTSRLDDWLRSVAGRLTDAVVHEHASLGEIQRWAGLRAAPEMFRSLVLYENYPGAPTLDAELRVVSVDIEQQAPFAITLLGVPEETGLGLVLSYRDPIDAVTAETIIGQVAAVLESLAHLPMDAPLEAVALGPAADQRLSGRFARGAVPLPVDAGELGPGERWALVDADDRPVPVGAPGALVVVDAHPADRVPSGRPLMVRRRVPEQQLRLAGDESLELWRRPRLVRSSSGSPVDLDVIQTAIAGCPQVEVVVVETEGGTGRVVAFCEPVADGTLTIAAVWDHLLRLDGSDLPDVVEVVARLPRSTTGEIVVADLPWPGDAEADRGDDDVAATELLLVTELWEELLETDDVLPHADFFELGGDSLLGIRLLERLQQTFEVAVSLEAALVDPTPVGMVHAVQAAAVADGAGGPSPRRQRAPDVRADAVLDEQVREPAPLRHHPLLERVALTGADTFLGAHLAADLLERGVPELVVLDARSPGSALETLARRWSTWGLWDETHRDRLRIVRVRLGAPRLGLEPSAWDRLAAEIDVVFHLGGGRDGALASYAEMVRLNVDSTRTLLELAVTHHPKAVHVLSTLYVAPRVRGGLTEDLASRPSSLMGSYEESKWVVEQIVAAAAHRGVLARAYRVGEVVGSVETGACDRDSTIVRLLVASLRLGVVPRATLPVVLSSVEFVTGALLDLAVGLAPGEAPVAHLVDPERSTAEPFHVAPLLAAMGIDVEVRNHATWRSLVTASAARGTAEVLPRQVERGLVHQRGWVRDAGRDALLWGRGVGRRHPVAATATRAATSYRDRAVDVEVLARVLRHLVMVGAIDPRPELELALEEGAR